MSTKDQSELLSIKTLWEFVRYWIPVISLSIALILNYERLGFNSYSLAITFLVILSIGLYWWVYRLVKQLKSSSNKLDMVEKDLTIIKTVHEKLEKDHLELTKRHDSLANVYTQTRTKLEKHEIVTPFLQQLLILTLSSAAPDYRDQVMQSYEALRRSLNE